MSTDADEEEDEEERPLVIEEDTAEVKSINNKTTIKSTPQQQQQPPHSGHQSLDLSRRTTGQVRTSGFSISDLVHINNTQPEVKVAQINANDAQAAYNANKVCSLVA